MARKTVKVDELKEYVNKLLAIEELHVEHKAGLIDMIHHVLHKTDNYQGFMFINNEDSEIGTPGWHNRKYF